MVVSRVCSDGQSEANMDIAETSVIESQSCPNPSCSHFSKSKISKNSSPEALSALSVALSMTAKISSTSQECSAGAIGCRVSQER